MNKQGKLLLLLILCAVMLFAAGCGKGAKEYRTVDEKLEQTVQDESFSQMTQEERCEVLRQTLESMAAEGQIQEDSVEYDEVSGVYSFVYADGVLGGVCTREQDDEWNTAGTSSTGGTDVPLDLDGETLNARIFNGFENTAFRRDFYEDLETAWDAVGMETSIDVDVTVRDMQNLSGNDVVIFAMHGNHFRGQPALCLNEQVTTATDERYSTELRGQQVARVTLTTGALSYWVLDDLFTESYESLDCDLIFSESCKFYGCDCISAMDDSMAETLANLSGGVVIGYHNSVGAIYSREMMRDTINALLEGENYNDALQGAIDIHGANDGMVDSDEDKFLAFPVLTGNGDNTLVAVPVTDFTMDEEMTITIGELSVIEPVLEPAGASGYSIRWSSSDESVVTVTSNGSVGIVTAHAKGNAEITAVLTSAGRTITRTTAVRVATKARDTVLVLDVSGSMSGEPMQEMKEAAIQFCNDLLKDEYNNRVGLVFYDDDVWTVELTDDLDMLIEQIRSVSDGGTTNMEGGLAAADEMLSSSSKPGTIQNVVIMADGLPNEGKLSYSGSMEVEWYESLVYGAEYASAVVDTAQIMMPRYNMYSLGFFHGMDELTKEYAARLMQKLTNQTDGYYQVEEAENLQFAFGDISEEISMGSKIVINIACPVDVTVIYDGERLSSAEKDYCESTSFGTLQLLGKDRDIKVLSLDSDKQYEIELRGTGTGTMDYSVNYYDDAEKLIDFRTFESVPITMNAVIKTDTDNVSKDIALNIDEDGDGEIDEIWTAKARSNGQITYQRKPGFSLSDEQLRRLVIILVIAAAVIVLLLIILVGSKSKRRRPKRKRSICEEDGETSRFTPADELPLKKRVPEVKPTEPKKSDMSKEIPDGQVEKADGDETEPIPCKTGVLEIVTGSMRNYRIPIKDGEILRLGKDARLAHVVFSKDYPYVSRLHCSIEYDSKLDAYFVTDYSSNGTRTNGRGVLKKGQRTMVAAGAALLLGNESCTILLG